MDKRLLRLHRIHNSEYREPVSATNRKSQIQENEVGRDFLDRLLVIHDHDHSLCHELPHPCVERAHWLFTSRAAGCCSFDYCYRS